MVIYKRFSALLHIDNIQCLLCYPVVQTVIPAMYLTSTSCPTAVRSARRKLMVRTVHIFLEEAEQSGYLFPVIIKDIVAENKKVEYHAAIAVQQHDLVVDQFGANAWDNVSYTLKEIEPVDGELGYRVKSTGKLVDKAEYEEILYEYWGNVAAQEGTSYADIFLTEGEPSENIANKRVDIMLEEGLLEEAERVINSDLSYTSIKAIGYKELIPYFKENKNLNDCVEKLKMETRRYAKRQITWFKRDSEINWIYIDEYNSFEEIYSYAKAVIERGLLYG